ncbi:wall-associated receptor kinase [Artemisia annua]|uniref:Wall-associated receptor kinase n=1 Tax=Artemisia annua TaxID=35608 RepID=A0A2U1KZR5_ARTAN|nr:wall-associated receptor kinase [Artemisia annua]
MVYVDSPKDGTAITQGSSFGAFESVKVTSDINSPIPREAIPKYAKTGCKDKCGNMTIPYPFGIGKKMFSQQMV